MTSSNLKETTDIWLCLRFPYLALNCADLRFNTRRASAVMVPAVVIEQQKIIQANRLAQSNGIKLGQAVEHARMLCSNLSIIERQAELEANKLQALCAWAYRYTSHISVYDNHTLLLEIGRSLSFFKGINSMQNLVLADLERLDIDVKCGVAHTPKAAHLLSYGAQKQWHLADYQASIRQSQLKHLAIPEKTLTQLYGCGFELLQDISAIPKAQLGARFGKPFTLYLEQLMGDTADPQSLHCTPEIFNAKIDFAQPISNREWIQQQIDRLLNDLVIFTNNRQLVCRSLTWRFFSEHRHLADSITIRLNMSTLKLRNLQELTELKLSTLSLRWAFSSIELSSEELIPKNLFHQDLFDPIADQEEFNQLIDKLSSRLGNNAIYGIGLADEHLPELANIRCGVESKKAVNNKPADHTNESQQDKPIWLLKQPQELTQTLGNKLGQPEHHGELEFIHGPKRISSHWWQALQSRDYYIAKQTTGRLLWVYYERSQQNWYLHGLYA